MKEGLEGGGGPKNEGSNSGAPRKRGGQPGNRNRLRHGCFSGAYARRRKAQDALIAAAMALLAALPMTQERP